MVVFFCNLNATQHQTGALTANVKTTWFNQNHGLNINAPSVVPNACISNDNLGATAVTPNHIGFDTNLV